MLRYPGHPITDVGIPTIAAFYDKSDPSSLSQEVYSSDTVTVSDNIGGDIEGTYSALSW